MPIELGIEEQLSAGAAIIGFTLGLVTPVHRQTLSLKLTGGGQRFSTADDRAVDFTSHQRITEFEDQTLRFITAGPRVDSCSIRQCEPTQNRQRRATAAPKGGDDGHDKIGHGVSEHSYASETIYQRVQRLSRASIGQCSFTRARRQILWHQSFELTVKTLGKLTCAQQNGRIGINGHLSDSGYSTRTAQSP